MIREGIIGGGSSPLARGLPEVLVDLVHGPGIIPARAGFTNRHSRCRTHAQDHPCSRGVYASVACASAFAAGSSPLARGLPRAGRRCRSTSGIIPARAGFTKAFERRGPVASDHPRSRGVYTEYVVGDTWREGSSPLARGLRRHPDRRRRRPGIIPARAGFTRSPLSRSLGWRDHPRSRGVYQAVTTEVLEGQGSSPLARGLRVRQIMDASLCRIIPARAGFTARGLPRAARAPDHPRSRGVYHLALTFIVTTTGSSPLARGLLDAPLHRQEPVRIIPARAGFTPADNCPGWTIWDHPRSRGVYDNLKAANPNETGSSPLARGLRAGSWGRVLRVRIIPARAGFTRRETLHRPGHRDHPRSRGVYRNPYFPKGA